MLPERDERARAWTGFVNAHSHTFQRRLRAAAAGDSFWSWRDAMLELAASLDTPTLGVDYAAVYGEMLDNGYTAVGEFHYLGVEEAFAVQAAAAEAGIALVLLHAAYGRGGVPRFRQASASDYLREVERLRGAGLTVGLAPHSIRACPRDWLEEIGRYAAAERLPLHVHACEQPQELELCLEEHGMTPIELLAETGCLGERTTVVHATHASDHELDLLAETGARVCICPTTEASLGDGFAPVLRFLERRIRLCIGSDSNVRIDPLEELRELNGIARRLALRRDVFSVEGLLAIGREESGAALGLEGWPATMLNLDHRSLLGVDEADLDAALVYSCSSDVFSRP